MRATRSVGAVVTAAILVASFGVARAGAVRRASTVRQSAAPIELDRFVADRSPLVAAAATPSGTGYWMFLRDGAVVPFGDAHTLSPLATLPPGPAVVGAARTPDASGYWQVRNDGGVFAFGDAHFYGSTRDLRLNEPLIGMSATTTGHGYWLLAADGGIFSFGDAHFYGSTGNLKLNEPIIGMAPTPSGTGYWLLAADGGIFSYGDAHFYGSTGNLKLNQPIVAMAATPSGHGYWLLAADGGIFSYGDARFYGSIAASVPGGVRAIVAAPGGEGYWLFTAHGAVLPFGHAASLGIVIRPHDGSDVRPRIAYYGDSLVTQAESDLSLLANLQHWNASLEDYPGTALCDYLDFMSADAVSARPDVAVIAFSGNALTPCMKGPAGTFLPQDEVAGRYHESAELAVALFAAEGTQVVLAGGPPFYGSAGESAVNRAYMAVAAEHPRAAQFADAGAAVAGPGRAWSKTLPCLSFETAAMGCAGGRIIVRSPDTVHFCPGQPIVTRTWRMPCPVWSSGAWRYAMGLTAGASEGLHAADG